MLFGVCQLQQSLKTSMVIFGKKNALNSRYSINIFIFLTYELHLEHLPYQICFLHRGCFDFFSLTWGRDVYHGICPGPHVRLTISIV